ncbi:family 16 glycoside hydrolase [Ohtaekwangia koreensis]|uniref:3-keto-alpha-glucoside-1,2-lyase/3-keto-2-hydroxy-glucal hydratase domain-containing protein n=1 Tax=Ohtaekwangia koreensis TaxID=688867 RepID=A0A1T5KD55_9BACT|nr:family 16 glycoside hydrolase [Ohtaekwangia koreensis]SKC61604.1 hypothetical protein SAMN05660236_2052 [Ohtaekwangia koreensis]
MKRNLFTFLVVLISFSYSQAQNKIEIPLKNVTQLLPVNVSLSTETYLGKPSVKVVENIKESERASFKAESVYAKVKDVTFKNGVIELEVSGKVAPNAPEGSRGFVGIAFRVQNDDSKFELIYLRPTNGRADDQMRRNHSVQYSSFPDYPWDRLRSETPEKYETYVDLVPGEWTKMKIEVEGDKARLYVHGATQPTLIVNDLKLGAEQEGGIALWIGPGTEAHFTNLKVTRK